MNKQIQNLEAKVAGLRIAAEAAEKAAIFAAINGRHLTHTLAEALGAAPAPMKETRDAELEALEAEGKLAKALTALARAKGREVMLKAADAAYNRLQCLVPARDTRLDNVRVKFLLGYATMQDVAAEAARLEAADLAAWAAEEARLHRLEAEAAAAREEADRRRRIADTMKKAARAAKARRKAAERLRIAQRSEPALDEAAILARFLMP